MANAPRVAVPRLGCVGERLVDHARELLGHRGVALAQRHDAAAEDDGEGVVVRVEVARVLAGEEEVERRGEAPHVAHRAHLPVSS